MVPETLSVTLGERRDGSASIHSKGTEEQIDTILGQEAQNILPRAVPLGSRRPGRSSGAGGATLRAQRKSPLR